MNKVKHLQQFENIRKLYLELKSQVSGGEKEDSTIEDFALTALDPVEGAENIARNIFKDITGVLSFKFYKLACP